MDEKKEKRAPQPEVIALPPLRMVLVHAKDQHVSKAALTTAIKKIALQSVKAKVHLEPQVVMKLIQYLEKKS